MVKSTAGRWNEHLWVPARQATVCRNCDAVSVCMLAMISVQMKILLQMNVDGNRGEDAMAHLQ